MDKQLKHTRRLSWKQELVTVDTSKVQTKNSQENKTIEKKSSEKEMTSPRMISQSQKPHSPPKPTVLKKSQSEKQSEITVEMKSLNSRKSLSPLPLHKLTGEINFSPEGGAASPNHANFNTSPYKEPVPSLTKLTTTLDAAIVHAQSIEPVSPSSPKNTKQESRAGALHFAELPADYQELIKKNNGVITSPKDLAALFFLVETECGKVEPNKTKMSTPFRSEAKITEIPKEIAAENINLYEAYWNFLGKEGFDNEEIKKIRHSVVENYSKYREIYEVVTKDKSAKEIIENEIGFTVLKVIFDPLIQHLVGGDVVFNKAANEKIERQPSKLSKLLCEFIYTLDEKIINWCNEHQTSTTNDLILGRKNTFFNLIIFRGLIKIWTDEVAMEDKNSTVLNQDKLALMKMLNSFLNTNIDLLFEKIINCSDEEKNQNLHLANKLLEAILQHEKIENRKKEIMHSMSTINLPKDKYLSKTGNRNSQPYYGSVRDSLSPRNKSLSMTARDHIEHKEKEQFIDELIVKLDIPLSIAEFKQDLKQSLMDIKGREIRIFEKRPFMTCKDNLMAYLAAHEEIPSNEIKDFMDKLNSEVSREVVEMERERKIRDSSKGEDSSPRKISQETSTEKEKE